MAISPLILLNEKQLFARIAEGDEAAFSEIFYHYTPRIQPFIKKMTRSEEAAEDIVQDVFVSLWKNRLAMLGVENFQSYIFTMATNKTYNYLKSKAREIKGLYHVAQHNHDYSNSTQELLDLHESQVKINELVEQLSPQKKMIYKLTREEGLSHDEIAQKLGISKNTVKNHLIETLKFLRENLQKSYGTTLLFISIMIKIHSN